MFKCCIQVFFTMMPDFEEDPTSSEPLPDNASESVEMPNDADVNSECQRLLIQSVNNNYARSVVTVTEILQYVANNGGESFNIFLNS